MTDTLQADINRGQRAEILLADETLTAAFTGLETEYVAAWKATPARDTDARERLWQAVQIVGKVRTQLANYVADGTLAKREIDDLAGKQKRFGII